MDTNLPATVPLLLHDLSRDMRQLFDIRARKFGVTRTQWRALMMMRRFDGPTQTELADVLEVERITAGRMVDRLVECGLVERRSDPSDRRVWRLYLLPAADGIVTELSNTSVELEREALAALTPKQREELIQTLAALRTAMKKLREDIDCKKEVA